MILLVPAQKLVDVFTNLSSKSQDNNNMEMNAMLKVGMHAYHPQPQAI